MKIFNFIALLGFLTAHAQELKYQLYLRDSCDQSIKKSDFYSLKKGNEEYQIINSDLSIKVPKEGNYILESNETEERMIIKISRDHNSDTLVLPSFTERVKIPLESYTTQMIKSNREKMLLESRSVWEKCGKPLNGLKKDYFSDGSFRMEGTFKEGYPIGNLREYYQNGNLKSLLTYNDKGILIQKRLFDKSGKELKVE